jgi:hypothetical protein
LDWVSVLIAVVIALFGLAESSKKKKRSQAKKAAPTKNTVNADRMNGQKQSRPQHPYAESPKGKGMSLDDFRRKYEQAQSKAKDIVEETRNAFPEGFGSPAEGSSMEGPFPKPKPRQKPQTKRQAEKAPNREWQTAAAETKAPNKEQGVITVTKPVQTQRSLSVDGYGDVAAYMASKNFTPMQQAFLWSEILGPPKAKQRRL